MGQWKPFKYQKKTSRKVRKGFIGRPKKRLRREPLVFKKGRAQTVGPQPVAVTRSGSTLLTLGK